jgi:hypothetical protein
MTVVSTITCENQRLATIDRLALRLGLALVAYARRSAYRATPTREELQLRHEADRLAHQLRAERDGARGIPGIR